MDPALVEDIERQARRLATDVDSVVENLACILQSISALTVDTVETYRWVVVRDREPRLYPPVHISTHSGHCGYLQVGGCKR